VWFKEPLGAVMEMELLVVLKMSPKRWSKMDTTLPFIQVVVAVETIFIVI